MDLYTINYVKSNPLVYQYLRANSSWYQRLNRDPVSIKELEKEAKSYYQLTIPDKIEKLEQLKKEISSLDIVEELHKRKDEVMNDSSLVEKIEEYKKHPEESLKKEIISSPSFLAYKEMETEIDLLILKLNQEFKKIRKKYDCR